MSFKRCGGGERIDTQVPIVVAVNASPLIGLAKGRRLPLLRLLYDEVLIPSLVYDDVVVKGLRRTGARAVGNAVTAGWLQVVAVSDASVVPAEFRGTGEGEVIATVHGLAEKRCSGVPMGLSSSIMDRTNLQCEQRRNIPWQQC